MSKNNTLWWILLLGWIGAGTWWHNCRIKQLCDEPLSSFSSQPAKKSASPFQLQDGTDFSLSSQGNFGFARSGAEPNLGMVQPQIDSLVAYLQTNPGKTLVIKGYYESEERNDTSWPNLGVARAEGLKALLLSRGIQGNRLSTEGVLNDELVFEADSLNGGLEVGFGMPLAPAAATDEELANQQKFNGIFKPLDLYFKLGSSQYIKTKDNETFVKEAKAYLKANPDKKLLLTGHTDNTGTSAGNLALSKRRAASVKRMLVRQGMTASQLVTDGKGQQEPKADNSTADGRATNRRCAIIVQ